MKTCLKTFIVTFLAGLLIIIAFVSFWEPNRCVLCEHPPQELPCVVSLPYGRIAPCSNSSQEAGSGCVYELKKANLFRIDAFSYCRICRDKLRKYFLQEAVLADLYDPENHRFYPLTDGAVYNIRNYRISVETLKDGSVIIVEGTLAQ